MSPAQRQLLAFTLQATQKRLCRGVVYLRGRFQRRDLLKSGVSKHPTHLLSQNRKWHCLTNLASWHCQSRLQQFHSCNYYLVLVVTSIRITLQLLNWIGLAQKGTCYHCYDSAGDCMKTTTYWLSYRFIPVVNCEQRSYCVPNDF